MIEKKRFELGNGDKGPLIYNNNADDDYYFVNDEKELQEFIDLVNEELSENECIERLHQLHKTISELSAEILKIKEEHREDEFKLHTLEKWYTCPNCAFNKREFKYLKNLRRD